MHQPSHAPAQFRFANSRRHARSKLLRNFSLPSQREPALRFLAVGLSPNKIKKINAHTS
jgi:hypothetical protein